MNKVANHKDMISDDSLTANNQQVTTHIINNIKEREAVESKNPFVEESHKTILNKPETERTGSQNLNNFNVNQTDSNKTTVDNNNNKRDFWSLLAYLLGFFFSIFGIAFYLIFSNRSINQKASIFGASFSLILVNVSALYFLTLFIWNAEESLLMGNKSAFTESVIEPVQRVLLSQDTLSFFRTGFQNGMLNPRQVL